MGKPSTKGLNMEKDFSIGKDISLGVNISGGKLIVTVTADAADGVEALLSILEDKSPKWAQGVEKGIGPLLIEMISAIK